MSDPATGPSVKRPNTGERISFFEEQARRRTQAQAWSFVAMGVAGLMGWVLGFLVMAAGLFYVTLLHSFFPRRLAQWIERIGPKDDAVFWPLMMAGIFFAFALWMAVRMIFGRDTSASFLPKLSARAPNLSDSKEKQLVNVVEEMAIAASAPAARLLLFDGETVNAAALGPDATHVTLLVSRRMLDVLDRDETQGVVAHLTASAINGDLSLSAEMLRLFYVLGLAVTILDLPFSGRARSALWALIPLVFRSRSAGGAEERAVAERLTDSLRPEGLDPLIKFMQWAVEPKTDSAVRKIVGSCLMLPLLPLIMIRIAAFLLYGMLTLFVLGPLVAGLLRTRRRLADATAVQLTRNPDGLACALVTLMRDAHTVENAGWAEMLFIVGPEADGFRRMEKFRRRLRAARESGRDIPEQPSQTPLAVTNELVASREPESAAKRHSFVFGFHPSIGSRITQLKHMGATKVEWEERKDYSVWVIAIVAAFIIGGVVLLAIASSRK